MVAWGPSPPNTPIVFIRDLLWDDSTKRSLEPARSRMATRCATRGNCLADESVPAKIQLRLLRGSCWRRQAIAASWNWQDRAGTARLSWSLLDHNGEIHPLVDGAIEVVD